MEGAIRFDMNHYMKVYSARKEKERYCFPLKMFLGENGLYENHPLKGKTFRRRFNGERFTVDNVYVHWYQGWYYVALARNKGNSHTSITWNINSSKEIIGEFTLQDFVLQD